MRMLSRRTLLLFALTAFLPNPSSRASDRRDHERARAALAAGEIKPLSDLLSAVEQRYVGKVVETELEREGDRWVYEIKLLPPSGRVFELKLDAATGALLRSRGSVQERR